MEKKTKTKVNIVLGIVVPVVYCLIPVDIVPDTVPIAGWIDDAIVVLAFVANAIRIMNNLKKK